MSELEQQIRDSWYPLRKYTDARIALGKTGVSIPVQESLNFKLAHAHARDAVYSSLNIDALLTALEGFNLSTQVLRTQAKTRQEYLLRPDWGRKLDEASRLKLMADNEPDVAIILADGLSATAINEHATNLLSLLIPALQQANLILAPISIVEQGRVAIGDDIGSTLKARLALVLIGERPGLSSPNSMGAYITYRPSVGLTDETRNCVSNIRPEGLAYSLACHKIFYLITESLKRKLSGVELKDDSSLLN